MSRVIHTIVIHCAATANGVSLGRIGYPGKSAAQVIDGWHHARDFQRSAAWREKQNSHLQAIGYHFVIDVDGSVETGRHVDERGAHAAGHNFNSIGVCLVGTDKFTIAQWTSLREVVQQLLNRYPNARVCGHRDLSPDHNGDGRITSNEWTKTCPGFDAGTWWLRRNFEPMLGHILTG